jgi:hypothetical protein
MLKKSMHVLLMPNKKFGKSTVTYKTSLVSAGASLSLPLDKKINLGICIAPTQPFRAALGAESKVCYPSNTADRQTQRALTYYHLSQSAANQNRKLIHCHRWDSNS